MTNVVLKPTSKSECESFRKNLQEAFIIAVEENFGIYDNGSIPSDEEIEQCFNSDGVQVFNIMENDQIVGGVALTTDEKTNHNSLDLLYVSPKCHSKGIGASAWKKIERRYPKNKSMGNLYPLF